VGKDVVSMVSVARAKATVISIVIANQALCVETTTASWVLVTEQGPKDGTKKTIAATIPGSTQMQFVLEVKVVVNMAFVMLEKAIVMLIAIVNRDLNVAPTTVSLVSVLKRAIIDGMKRTTVVMIHQLIQAGAREWKNVALMDVVVLVKEIATTTAIA